LNDVLVKLPCQLTTELKKLISNPADSCKIRRGKEYIINMMEITVALSRRHATVLAIDGGVFEN